MRHPWMRRSIRIGCGLAVLLLTITSALSFAISAPAAHAAGDTLAHDHRYIVQEEWSLHDQACVLSYAPSPGS